MILLIKKDDCRVKQEYLLLLIPFLSTNSINDIYEKSEANFLFCVSMSQLSSTITR